MRKALLDTLVDPVTGTSLQVEAPSRVAGEDILEGVLRSSAGTSYRISRGIPRFVMSDDQDQKQTESSFGFKWKQRDTYDSPQVHMTARKWFMERYGFPNVVEMQDFFGSRRRILDAGCGSGFSSSLFMGDDWRAKAKAEWIGVDVSEAIDVAEERLGSDPRTHFIQADILHLPFRHEAFDTILAEGVLHHTPSTERAFKSLIPLLERGGEILFYVYRKKAPVREFTDDYIRSIVRSWSPKKLGRSSAR